MWSQKEVIAPTEASLKTKNKILRLSSASFSHDLCDIPERSAVIHSCLRFLAGNKNAGFWREKKRQNSQNFSAKMPEKISHFIALIADREHWEQCTEKINNKQ